MRTHRHTPWLLMVLLLLLGSCGHATTETGIGSYYASKFHGRKTANGERYDPQKMTAAHRTLPMGTTVRVTNLRNNRSVVLRINDRGPFVHGRIIDVSAAAARALGFVREGLTHVRVDVMTLGG